MTDHNEGGFFGQNSCREHLLVTGESHMYLKASKRILQNKRFWRANELYFRVHRDREFWLELWEAILTKCKLTIQNINFFNVKPFSRKNTDRKKYFSYIKRVYIFSRKNFKVF